MRNHRPASDEHSVWGVTTTNQFQPGGCKRPANLINRLRARQPTSTRTLSTLILDSMAEGLWQLRQSSSLHTANQPYHKRTRLGSSTWGSTMQSLLLMICLLAWVSLVDCCHLRFGWL